MDEIIQLIKERNIDELHKREYIDPAILPHEESILYQFYTRRFVRSFQSVFIEFGETDLPWNLLEDCTIFYGIKPEWLSESRIKNLNIRSYISLISCAIDNGLPEIFINEYLEIDDPGYELFLFLIQRGMNMTVVLDFKIYFETFLIYNKIRKFQLVFKENDEKNLKNTSDMILGIVRVRNIYEGQDLNEAIEAAINHIYDLKLFKHIIKLFDTFDIVLQTKIKNKIT